MSDAVPTACAPALYSPFPGLLETVDALSAQAWHFPWKNDCEVVSVISSVGPTMATMALVRCHRGKIRCTGKSGRVPKYPRQTTRSRKTPNRVRYPHSDEPPRGYRYFLTRTKEPGKSRVVADLGGKNDRALDIDDRDTSETFSRLHSGDHLHPLSLSIHAFFHRGG